MDIIFLRELKIETIIGIYDWERKNKQTVILDLDMGTDIRSAAQSDNIEDTLDYKAVSDRLIAFIENSSFMLVETMAEQITEILLQEFKIPWVRLQINKKGAIGGNSDVGIVIERGEKN